MRAATLEKVQSAAVRLFAHRGFAATSMRDIAGEAGISTGLIYRHYATKDDLFAALVVGAADGLRDVAARLRGDGSPAALVRDFTTGFVADVDRTRGFAEFFLLMNQAFAAPGGSAPVRDLVTQHVAMVEATVALIVRGQQLGRFRRGDPAQLATCYFAALSGLATMKLALGDRLAVPHPSLLAGWLIEEGSDD
ncbi:TetR family transcriptional regulator [Pseudonocardia sp. MH-G8]|nr:TetR family transcriptional regulator [Pseudonocardia sp. MH-G8]